MKRLSLYLFLILFTLPTPSQADDIRDFQIEGMSIGDSLLDYFSKNEIEENIQHDYYKDDLYYESQIENETFHDYQGVTLIFFSNDKNYIIQGIGGYKYIDLKKCLVERNEIKKVMDEIWPNATPDEYTNKHQADKSGKSKYHHTLYELRDGKKVIGNAIIECADWSSEITNTKGWTDNLSLRITTEDFEQWLINEAYK